MRTNYVSVNHRSVRKCNVSGLRAAKSKERLCEDKEGAENFFVAYCLLGVCYYAVLLSE